MGNNVSQQSEKRKARHAQTLSPPQKSSQRFSTSSLAASVGLSKRSPRQNSSVPSLSPPTIFAVPEPLPQPEPEQDSKPSTPPPPPPEKESIPEPVIEGSYAQGAIMSSQSATVPCQYRTGRTLGSGTYAIVKEAIHIKTGKYYACKVINKKLMEGREHMVRNEIAVLKRISSGHPNIVTLHDYFETSHNLYLCFDLCTGGELFDSICARGQYTEADAAGLVRTIFQAVKYIHDCGIVHRDLKPENLLFRSKPEKTSEIMIADFGLSRVMEENKLSMLKEVCGTPGYMAPEIFQKTGHGKPVDVWAMGVITYFLLAGYTPFDRDTQRQEMEAIIAGDYKFEPDEYWSIVSDTARDFVATCLTTDPEKRPTAAQMLEHHWLASEVPHFVENETGEPRDLLPHVRKAFDAKKTFRKAVFGMMAMKRMSTLAHHMSPEAHKLNEDLYQFKQESEKEVLEDIQVVHHHNADEERSLKSHDDISIAKGPNGKVAHGTDVSEKLAAVSLAAKSGGNPKSV
ncbi:kinase-like domain-containing protein [Suillus subalutaceus]|uniref:kinase-like domain-containing protein n=1 Tax=Suillus subalutaceus TaxID=48586 RepID=UPI001B8745A2|nr:kinase-like domain-containing protein [Suillus subalutaceus]KAG1872899.1 kinase-like domain-containing protein [Suillus subalutaceus]